MITHVDFTARRPVYTALDHATREAARCYADQYLDGWRAGFALLVRDAPADAHYQRAPMIQSEQVGHLDLGRLGRDEKDEVTALAYHEKFVTLAGALAFQRRTGQPVEALLAGLAPARGAHAPMADVTSIERRLFSRLHDSERAILMSIQMGRADRFLDRNWQGICRLAEDACKAPVDADSWRVVTPAQVEAILRRRPLKLTKEERDTLKQRRVRSTCAAGRDLVRRLGLTAL